MTRTVADQVREALKEASRKLYEREGPVLGVGYLASAADHIDEPTALLLRRLIR